MLDDVLARRRGGDPSYYDRRSWEELVVVNTSGDLYADLDAYVQRRLDEATAAGVLDVASWPARSESPLLGA